MNTRKDKILSAVRGFLFHLVNKEFLIFLCFLALSTGFWFIMALNDTYEREIPFKITLTGVPDNIIITDGLPDTVRVTIKDKGYALIPYYYADMIKPIRLPFSMYAKTNGHGNITTAELQRYIYQRLFTSTKITAIKSDKLDFEYSHGTSKRVKVLFDGQVKPAENTYISSIVVAPDSIMIYASQDRLDSIKELFTTEIVLDDVTDTLLHNVPLKKMQGVKFVPSSVSVRFICDILTEKLVTVPITAINLAPGYVIRTFPASVQVKVIAGKRLTKAIRPENFRVVVDYNELKKNPSEKCKLMLHTMPRGITSATLETQQVDYLIETVN